MKKTYKNLTIGFATGLLLLSGACNESDFLDRSPKVNPSPDIFFVDATSARMAVNACYDPWQWGAWGMVKRDMIILLDAMTDDSYWRPNRAPSIAIEQWNVSPVHENVRDWWKMLYQSIAAANLAISNIPKSSDPNFTQEQQASYIAEARFFRAYSYLFLTTFYGDVPLRLTPATTVEEFNTPRSPKAQVLAQVVLDFEYAKNNLPANQTLQGPPNSAAAGAFLAKTYLFLKDWSKAEAAAREAIKIAEDAGFKLEDEYLNVWNVERNSEVLFAWNFVEDDPIYSQNITVQRLCRDLPPELRIAINGDGWGYALPQRDLYDAFEDGDPRREFTLYSPGHDYEIYPGPNPVTVKHEKYDETGKVVKWEKVYNAGDMVEYDYKWSPTGLSVKKMTNSLNDVSNVRWDGMDVPVMRMAELYLILGEALAEQGKSEALFWVNKVRARASVNMPPKTDADGSLVDIVRHERRVELAMEGLRIFDLIRWGTLSEVFGDGTKVKRNFFSDYLPDGPGSASTKYDAPTGNLNLDPLFPIPQDEIDYNKNINTNNPGW